MPLAHQHRSPSFWLPKRQPTSQVELDQKSPFTPGLVALYPHIAFSTNNLANSNLGPLAWNGNLQATQSTEWGNSPYSNGGSSTVYLTASDVNGVLPSGSADSTTSCWMFTAGSGGVGNQAFVGWGATGGGQARELRVSNATTTGAFTNYTAFVTGGPSVVDVKAHHLVGVVSGGNWSTYVDGALVAGPTALTTSTTANSTLYVGKLLFGTGTIVQGGVDNVAIWNRALSATEIAALYSRPYDYVRGKRMRIVGRTIAGGGGGGGSGPGKARILVIA